MFKRRYQYKASKTQIVLETPVLEVFQNNVQHSIRDHEKGGLLFGRLYPEENLIVVTEAKRINSIKSGYTELYIDLEEANEYIKKVWEESKGKITYLGDWHTHHERSPLPSPTDYVTFKSTYHHSKIDQNVLICAIVGTNTIERKGLFIGIRSYFKFHKLFYSKKYKLFTKNTDILNS